MLGPVGDDRTIPSPTEARLATVGTSRLAPRIELVDLAAEIARADESIASTTNARLEILAEQIRALQAKARQVLDEARESLDLHRARANFVKRPGQVYHLYRRGEELLFSMLSPSDWNDAPPYDFVGSYRLETDLRWTRVDADEVVR